jgi:DNA-binding CsgD family transcriptional regulator
MGDDTFHCIGTVMETRWGYGCVGMHRGRRQTTFDGGKLSALSEDIVHLRRMLGFRGRLKDAKRQTDRLSGALNSLGNPNLILSPTGQLLYANASGEELLRQEDGLKIRNGMLEASSASDNKQLRLAIARAADAQNPAATAVAVPRAVSPELNLSLVGTTAGGVHQVLVEIAAEPGASASVNQRVRELFGLSKAETDIATSLASGRTLDEIACDRGCAVATVRSQIKSVMQKMGCRRQSDVVRLICQLPTLR